MRPHEQARRLLVIARKDLKAAATLGAAEDIDAETVGFHIQQAAEKGLKAWLEIRGAVYPRTHDVSLLIGQLEDRGEDMAAFWPLVELNPFAVQFRYGLYDDEPFDWRDARAQAEALLAHVETLLDERR